MNPALRNNPWLLCAYYGVHSLLFPFAIFPLFWTQWIGMSVATMLAVQAFFGLSIALFEFPSGYIADRLGHRSALVLGTATVLVGWALYAGARSVAFVLLAELVLGVGFSLLSGADAALLYDSLHALGREAEFPRWYGRMRSIAQISEGASALLAGYLYARWVLLPFVAEVAVWSVALLLVVRLASSPRAPESQTRAPTMLAHAGRMRAIVKDALVVRADFRAVLLLGVAFSLASYLPVWLLALYAQESGVEVAWIGPIWAAGSFTAALGGLASEALRARIGLRRLLLGCVVLVALGYLGLALSHHRLSFAFYFLLTLMRGLHMPPLHHEEQRLAPGEDRASCVSLRSFLFRLGFVLCGPAIGAAVDRFGMHATLGAAGLAMSALTCAAYSLFSRQITLRGAPRPVG